MCTIYSTTYLRKGQLLLVKLGHYHAEPHEAEATPRTLQYCMIAARCVEQVCLAPKTARHFYPTERAGGTTVRDRARQDARGDSAACLRTCETAAASAAFVTGKCQNPLSARSSVCNLPCGLTLIGSLATTHSLSLTAARQ